jgi:hypothetical protein
VFVSTVLTLVVIPLGCVSAGNSLKQIAKARGFFEQHAVTQAGQDPTVSGTPRPEQS